MPDPNLFRVNRVPYSWTSGAHFFGGLPIKGVVASNFKETREVEIVHGAQQDGVPLGITSGIYMVENVQFTMLRDTALAFMTDLAAPSGGSYGDAEFSYLLQLFEPPIGAAGPIPSTPQSTLITGCRIVGVDEKQEKGSGALVTVFDCKALFLIRNGFLNLFSTARAAL